MVANRTVDVINVGSVVPLVQVAVVLWLLSNVWSYSVMFFVVPFCP